MRELNSLSDWRAWLATADPEPVAVQAVDLSAESGALTARTWADHLFLGCALSNEAAAHIVRSGGVVIPRLLDYAFEVHRPALYRVEDLYKGFDPDRPESYEATPDARIYREFMSHGGGKADTIRTCLARRLHDHSITDALLETLHGHKAVAVMGGHGMERADPMYRQVALFSRELSRSGYLLKTGGGPGAMEACHLGAYLADRPDTALDEALDLLRPRPPGRPAGKEYADPDWLTRAWRVRERFPESGRLHSIGVPTWLYGHEPPAVFAARHAKYFANSEREDGLLLWATHGVIFAPGSAGTIQEIFQDACQNHYQVTGHHSPMILFGSHHWTRVKPAWPLLHAVSEREPYGADVALTDDAAEVVARIRGFEPRTQG